MHPHTANHVVRAAGCDLIDRIRVQSANVARLGRLPPHKFVILVSLPIPPRRPNLARRPRDKFPHLCDAHRHREHQRVMAFVGAPIAVGRPRTAHLGARLPARGATHKLAARRVRATLGEKFGDRRGQDVPTVADAVAKFTGAFGRPVPIVYRSIINELLTTTHLATVCALWRYDAIFASGFEHVFEAFLAYYPNEDERDRLRAAVASALGLDATRLAADAAAVREWAEGMRDAESVFAAAAAEGEGGVTVEALRAVRKAATYEWYYSRCYGIGLITVMQTVGTDLTGPNAEIWADKLGIESSKFSAEMGAYLSNMERLKQAEQIFAEAAAREAKKTAERLGRRAEAAAKKLEELEKIGPDGPAPPATEGSAVPTGAAAGDDNKA